MTGNDLREALLEKIKPARVYADLFEGWQQGTNVACPKATEDHAAGEDKTPSMSLSADGKAYCHACGFKATSPIGVVEALRRVSFGAACRLLWDQYVEPLVPEAYLAKAHKSLMANAVLLLRLEEKRGIKEATIKKYGLGWDGLRLVIPIKNEFGLTVNARRYDLLKRHEGSPKMVSYSNPEYKDLKYGKARLWPLPGHNKEIFIFEGEMDTLLALELGLPALTVTGGANTWRDDWSIAFKGKRVIIVPDIDPANTKGVSVGVAGAEKRAAALRKYAASVRTVRLPVAGSKTEKDFTDWVIQRGGTAEALRAMASAPVKGVTGVEMEMPQVERAAPKDSDAELPEFDDMTKTEEINVARAEAAVAWMLSHGAFFRSQNGELYYAQTGGRAIRMSDKSETFLSFLSSRISKLINPASSSGKFVIRHLLSAGHMGSRDSISGSLSLYLNGAIYLYAGDDTILKARNGVIEVMKNAVNPERILLECPQQYHPIAYKKMASPEIGVRHLWNDIGQYLPMSEAHQYMLLAWSLGLYLREYVGPKPLMRLMASSATGKSTVSKLLSRMVYGTEFLQHSATTPAATYALSQRYPFLLFDNIETRNMTQAFEDYLMTAATGGMRNKRAISTDSGLIEESAKCLVLTNGIEPINKRELINRTLEIQLDLKKYGTKHFHETVVFDNLAQHRSEMNCGLLQMLTKYVVPRLNTGHVQRIAQEFREHSKKRFNEYMGVMALVLDGIWIFRPAVGYSEPKEMVKDWLREQSSVSQQQDEETNEVVQYLNIFAERRQNLMDAMTIVKKEGSTTIVRGTTRDLYVDFQLLAKHLGKRCPWQNERQLGTRLADADDILRAANWTRACKFNGGKRIYEYTKTTAKAEREN